MHKYDFKIYYISSHFHTLPHQSHCQGPTPHTRFQTTTNCIRVVRLGELGETLLRPVLVILQINNPWPDRQRGGERNSWMVKERAGEKADFPEFYLAEEAHMKQ